MLHTNLYHHRDYDYSRRFLKFDNSGGTEPEKLLSLRSRYTEENKAIKSIVSRWLRETPLSVK